MSFPNLKIAAKNTLILGACNIPLNISLAWGTKFISQIPTQGYIPAAFAGAIHSCTTAISAGVISKFGYDPIMDYFLKDKTNPAKKEKKEAHSQFVTITRIVSYSIATIVTTTTLPKIVTLAHRTISYKEAAAFAFINYISTYFINYLR